MGSINKRIQPLLITGDNKTSKWAGYIGLGIGIFILLFSLQMFINIQRILQQQQINKAGFDFISISKTVTNENMGKDNTFTEAELSILKEQPQINSISPLVTNQFSVTATAGSMIPFSSDLFLESIDPDFIDTLPASFDWETGQDIVPVIFSSDYLEMYNVFAPAQGLPQLSAKTISSVNLVLQCSGPGGSQNFRANIVALSDRINSVLVPQTFLSWCNQRFAGVATVQPSRVVIKMRDANDPAFISFLDNNNYHVNKEKIKFGRAKEILQNILTGLAVFGILVIGLAMMLFSFYMQLMIAKSKDNLKLLITLGFSPRSLTKNVMRSWLPIYITIIIVAVLFTTGVQFAFASSGLIIASKLQPFIHWSILLTAVFLFILTIGVNSITISGALNKISEP
ncbi:hypothetical protein BH20BAC1_BH20BAC1_18190 [soil metagenome]